MNKTRKTKKKGIKINIKKGISTPIIPAEVVLPKQVLYEELNELLLKNPKHFFGCGG